MNIDSILKGESMPDVHELSGLTLAFIGDSVYELFVRTKILSKGNRPASALHNTAVGFVKAKAQAVAILKIRDTLTEEELEIYKRGRNTNIHTVPKNADMNDYRQATGLEALIGYLYVTGQNERLNEVLALSFSAIETAE